MPVLKNNNGAQPSIEDIQNQIEFDFMRFTVDDMRIFSAVVNDVDVMGIAKCMRNILVKAPKHWGKLGDAEELIAQTSFFEFTALKSKFAVELAEVGESYDVNEYITWDIMAVKTSDIAAFHVANQESDFDAVVKIMLPFILSYPPEWGDLSSDNFSATMPFYALKYMYKGLLEAINSHQKK